MASNFENYTANDARVVVKKPDATAQSARKFLAGDHWQQSNAYIGPKNIGSRALGVSIGQALAEIKRGQVSQNVIKEILERHLAAVLGREPQWNVSVARPLKKEEQPKPEEQEAIAEANAAYIDWWDKRKGLIQFNEAGKHLLSTGDGHFRMFVPKGLLASKQDEATGRPLLDLKRKPKTLAEAMGRIYFEACEPGTAGIYVDRETMDEIGVYLKTIQVDGKPVTRVELYFVDQDDNLTTFRVLSEDTALSPKPRADGSMPPVAERKDIVEEGVQNLGGHLPLIEMRRDPLITAQVQQLQSYLNLGHTMGARNTVSAGFRERIVLNAAAPKEVVKDEITGEEKLVPMALPIGGAGVTHLTGISVKDKDKVRQFEKPEVIIKDPSGSENFVANKDMAYAAILEECHQRHALIAGDATVSGESRLQARADFAASVHPTKVQMDAAGRALFEAALAWAANMIGQAERYAGLRVSFDCRLDTEPLSSEEQAQIRSNAEGGFISYSTARTMLGVEDPDAEAAAIEAEELARAARDAQVASITAGQAKTKPAIPPTSGGDPAADSAKLPTTGGGVPVPGELVA